MIESLVRLDDTVFLLFNNGLQSPVADGLMALVTVAGGSTILIFFGLLTILLWLEENRLRTALVFVLTMALAGGAMHAVKRAIPRDRPILHFERLDSQPPVSVNAPHLKLRHRSFPSGHSQAAFTAAAFFALYFRRRRAMLYTAAGLVAFSRVYLGVHFVSDIVVGSLMGWLFAWIVWRFDPQAPGRVTSEPGA